MLSSHPQRRGQMRELPLLATAALPRSSYPGPVLPSLRVGGITEEGLHRDVAAPKQHAPSEGEIRRDGRLDSLRRLPLCVRELQPLEKELLLSKTCVGWSGEGGVTRARACGDIGCRHEEIFLQGG